MSMQNVQAAGISESSTVARPETIIDKDSYSDDDIPEEAASKRDSGLAHVNIIVESDSDPEYMDWLSSNDDDSDSDNKSTSNVMMKTMIASATYD
ncbi:hypothetical protein H4R24_005609 [Coemansia sp. RSA 988]|nr:hypothetical protein H4R24_005609 [Coemansia sp. RSA 988]